MKPRILLHSMTFKRDFGMTYILSKLLESMGCECFIAKNANLYRSFVRLWKPHVVFFVTYSRALPLRKAYPEAKLVHFSAEGGAFHTPDELAIIENPSVSDCIDLFCLWGQKTFDAISEKITRSANDGNSVVDIRDKCKVVGSPRMDIVRFYEQTREMGASGKVKIGLVGNSFYLNNIKFNTLQSMSMHQFKEGGDGQFTIDEIQFQIRLMELYYKLIKSLDPQKYSFSIRPYPLEDLKAYEYFPENVDVDTSLEFSSWLNRQDIIVGSTSTTITQIAIAEKPYINLDVLLERRDWEYNDIFADSLSCHQPKNMTETIEMVEAYENHRFSNSEMKSKLDYCYNAAFEGSILHEMARDILAQVERSKGRKFHIPTWALRKISDIWDRFISFKCKKSLEKDYSYFSSSQISEEIRSDLDQVVKNILLVEGPNGRITR